MKTKIIGDPHGKLVPYFNIVQKSEHYGENTLSVGDNGFLQEWQLGEQFLSRYEGGFDRHKWLGGNHDVYPNSQFKQSLPNYGEWNGIFFAKGARSIDKHLRIEGIDWFREEELSYAEMTECLDIYEQLKPKFVVTHDCPQSVRQTCFGFQEKDNTSFFLQQLFEIHQPQIWVFGHYHIGTTFYDNSTTFICLAELQTTILHH